MIVDVQTHLWRSPQQLGPELSAQLRAHYSSSYWQQLDAGPNAHDQAMEPIDVAFVCSFEAQALGAESTNRLIADYVAEDPQRRIGLASVDPTQPDQLQQLDEWMDLRFSGVVISPAAQDFHPSDTRAMRIYEKCEQNGLIVLIHQGGHFTRQIKMEYAQPYLFDEVARSFPHLRLIMAHCGYPWIDQTLVLVGKHDHVYANLAGMVERPWQLYQTLLNAYAEDVTDRILFASGFPFCTPSSAIETIYSLSRFTHGTALPTVPRERLRSIIERDTLATLGITRSGSAPARVSPARLRSDASERSQKEIEA